MGDRANVKIKEQEGGIIYLYTHWGGCELPQTLQAALQRGRDRWNDDAYLTRIIFCTMIPDSMKNETTGHGISTYVPDNEHDFLEVDVKAQMVRRLDGGSQAMKAEWSFEDYCALDLTDFDY